VLDKSDPCPHCGKTRCYEHCYEAKDGKHIADPKSVEVPDGADDFVVDLNCDLCGQSGGYRIDPTQIDWG
jgi:hypothetical protein